MGRFFKGLPPLAAPASLCPPLGMFPGRVVKSARPQPPMSLELMGIRLCWSPMVLEMDHSLGQGGRGRPGTAFCKAGSTLCTQYVSGKMGKEVDSHGQGPRTAVLSVRITWALVKMTDF